MIVKRILVLGISVFLIYNSDRICQYIADIGTDLANELSRNVSAIILLRRGSPGIITVFAIWSSVAEL